VGTTLVTGTANAVLFQWRVAMLSVFINFLLVLNTPDDSRSLGLLLAEALHFLRLQFADLSN
jgi:hypothetical protein